MSQLAPPRGFTIVELLIVIVVIGILATISIVAYSSIQERARVSQANSDLETLAKAISIARLNQNKVLKDVTGSNCTNCFPLATYELSLERIGAASGTNLNNLKSGDPWGNRYNLDENEGEYATCTADGLSVTNTASHPGLVVPKIPTYNCSL